jgi:hypothetical protein
MSSAPPHSLKCREIRSLFPQQSREIPANSLVSIVKPDQRKCFVLALHLDALPVSLIGKQAVRFPPSRPANETRRESDQLTKAT